MSTRDDLRAAFEAGATLGRDAGTGGTRIVPVDMFTEQVRGAFAMWYGTHVHQKVEREFRRGYVPTPEYMAREFFTDERAARTWVLPVEWKQLEPMPPLTQKRASPSARFPTPCARCGAGTYTGASVVEHDGPCAP